jgi:glycosyltransferase involved in cell wall biosynthesis
MPSRSVERFEGFGIVFIEAAHRRRTSVAGNHGGSPEAVDDGITGLVVVPTDVEAVAQAMAKLTDDEELRESLARKAQERAAN